MRKLTFALLAVAAFAVRKLAYTKCMAEVPSAVRADIRAE